MTDTERFERGRSLFNSRDFFDCHDVWEVLWMDARGSDRSLYQGLIQVAVAYYHAHNGNYRGASNLMCKGTLKLHAHVADTRINLSSALPRFLEHAEEFRERITRGGSFDASTVPRI